jgi:predicted nucleotidyltransferase
MMDISQLLRAVKIDKIIQYGNMSKGASDIDLLVISDDFNDIFIQKRRDFAKDRIIADKITDVICLTKKEHMLYKSEKNPYYENIKKSGRIIYDINKRN